MGDAAHATTPHLATGAGLAVEDALVLMDELSKASTIEAALEAHVQRRFARCAMVVENSVKIGQCQLGIGDPDQMFGLMQSSSAQLLEPY
jgi:2-polyprenyl-6-methoxyphenol hydroxylase-like FAD-dependent oxidoreductase